MKLKGIFRMAVDFAMTVLLLLLMAFMLTGQAAHEWLGAAELVLFIAHHVLNVGWLKSVGHGRYSPYRILQTLLAALVLLTMLGSMGSGILMSRYAFAFLHVRGGMATARTVHMLCAYWGFLLLSVHLGLHFSMMMGTAKKIAHIRKPSKARSVVLRLLALLLAACGAAAFVKNQIFNYLFLRSHFVFFDFSQPAPLFFAEYLAMMALWAAVGYYGGRIAQKRKKKEVTT